MSRSRADLLRSSRPLVVRFGALGDMVLMTVAIRLLSARFGNDVDVLASGNWTEPLLAGQPGVGEIYLLGSRRRPFWLAPDQWRLVQALKRRGPGPTWLFDAGNDKTRWLLQRAGWRSEHLVLLEQLPDVAGEHFCDRWRRFTQLDPPQLGGQAHPYDAAGVPQLHVSAQSHAELAPWLRELDLADRPFILIQAGNKRTMRRGAVQRRSNTKYWPVQHWAAVLRGLRSLHPGHALLLLGIAPEAALNDQILTAAKVSDAHNLARAMTVPRLMALAERAFGMISVDTGPAHVAAALGCPVLTLFDSAAKSQMYAPRGLRQSPRCLVVSAGPKPSLLSITPQQVLEAWRGMLEGDKPSSGQAAFRSRSGA